MKENAIFLNAHLKNFEKKLRAVLQTAGNNALVTVHLAYNTFAAQRDVITFFQTQEKEIDFQVMKLIISVWSASGNCSFSFC